MRRVPLVAVVLVLVAVSATAGPAAASAESGQPAASGASGMAAVSAASGEVAARGAVAVIAASGQPASAPASAGPAGAQAVAAARGGPADARAVAATSGSPAGARAAAGAAPVVRQLVVFRNGGALEETVSTRAARVRVGGRRCTASDGTALAALVRSQPGRLRLRDFGSCSRRPRDGAGLFVRSIRGDANRGQDGWVYKVGDRAATAGAADPAGPFGRGRLRAGQRVTWFYCRLRNGGCQRTLGLRLRREPGEVRATVRGFDDQGRGVPVEGATVTAGDAAALTNATGAARLALPAGRHVVVAAKPGLVRSFAERVEVP